MSIRMDTMLPALSNDLPYSYLIYRMYSPHSDRFGETILFDSFQFSVLFYSIKYSVNDILNVLSNDSIYHKHLFEWKMTSSRFMETKSETEEWTQFLIHS